MEQTHEDSNFVRHIPCEKCGSKDNAGLFYSFNTLTQLIKDSQDQNINLPIIEILDYPSLSYRSVHIDVKHHTEKKIDNTTPTRK